jgi:hypothetical protein
MEMFLFYLSWLGLEEFLSKSGTGAWVAQLNLDWIPKKEQNAPKLFRRLCTPVS